MGYLNNAGAACLWKKIKDLVETEAADTGWKTATLADGVTEVNACRYRKIGTHVFVRGRVAFTKTTSSDTLFTLPAGFRPPSATQYAINSVTGARAARNYINVSGVVKSEWIRALSDGTTVTGSISWLDIDMDFWVD